MPMPPVHFAVGMGVSSVLGAPLLALRRRWLIYLPLVMTLCGLLALAPDFLARGKELSSRLDFGAYSQRAHSHAPVMNIFFFHPALDALPRLEARETTELGFQAVALMYFLAICGYVAFIRWGLPRMAESAEAMARLRRAVAGYSAVGALAGIVPLVLLGAGVGWIVRGERPPQPTAQHAAREELWHWQRLVGSRMRLTPSQYLGLVREVPAEGAWLSGDLGARSSFSGGEAPLPDVVERALANRCDFVAMADGAGFGPPDAPAGRRAAYAAALDTARGKFRDIAILSGLSWNAPGAPAGETALVLVAPQATECELLAGFRQRFDRLAPGGPGESSEAALRWLKASNRAHLGVPVALVSATAASPGGWDQVYSWLRTNEVFLGIVGLPGGERVSSRSARSSWDPRVATVGGAWDQLLARGFQVWGAAAASGFRDPKKQFWPGEFARTHVWCHGRGPANVLAGLRSGCSWAEEGGIVRGLDFELSAPLLARPARMGEVVRVAPGAEVSVELVLDIPATDFAGRANAIDEVELISNFGGQPSIVQRFQNVRTGQRLRYAFPPAADDSGGLGFYVRARGRHRADDANLWFYTNPIRVLVRDGVPPPMARPIQVAAPRKPVEPGKAPEPAKPTTQVATAPPGPKEPQPPQPPKPGPPKPPEPAPPEAGKTLAMVGLPPEVGVVRMEGFEKRPGKQWQGAWTSNAPDRGPAVGDENLQITYVDKIPVGEATRLFFRCYGIDCDRLVVLLTTSLSGKPYKIVRELADSQWAEINLSLCDDFFPPLGAPGRLSPPAEVLAVEWRATSRGPRAGFFVTDFVVYEATPASRLTLARRRAEELALALRKATSGARLSDAWQARVDGAAARLAACRARLDPKAGQQALDQLGAMETEMDRLAEECRRLGLQATMARVFTLPDPRYAVGVESPARRASARNPALAFGGSIERACELWAAAGEAESVQLVVLPLWERLNAVEVTWSDLRPEGREGPALPRSALSASVVSEMWVNRREDLPPDRVGWIPDPLLPFVPFDVEPGSLRSVLVTVRVPLDLPPGDYAGTVTVRPLGLEPVHLALRLHRWDFALVGSHFSVVTAVDERALMEQFHHEKEVPKALRRQLYESLLRHRVNPIPLLGGDEAANMDDVTFCLEQGLSLAVLHQAASTTLSPTDSIVARASRYASKIWEAGWGRRGVLLLPMMRDATGQGAAVNALNAFGREHTALLLFAGGDGEAPAGLVTAYWRRAIGGEELGPPAPEAVEVRRSRTARREAWEVMPGAPDYPQANLTLVNLLVETRLVPWLAWRHGTRALLLAGANRWQQNPTGDGLLLYPGPTGDLYPSLRLVALRDGIEDYEYLWLLWDRARRLRERAPNRHLGLLAAVNQTLPEIDRQTGTLLHPARDPGALAAFRIRLGRVVERLDAAWWAEVDGSEDLPAAPAQLAAEPGDGQVTLTWPKSTYEKATAYNVYRSCDPKVGFTQVNASPVEALTHVDRSARNDVSYHYFVRTCQDEDVEGPHSRLVAATPRPAPKFVWLEMADLTLASAGPYNVLLRLEGPGTGGVLPLVRPQVDYCLSDGLYEGFREMNRRDDGIWTFEIPDLEWRRNASRKLLIKVRLVDRQNRVLAPPVERQELIDSVTVPRK